MMRLLTLFAWIVAAAPIAAQIEEIEKSVAKLPPAWKLERRVKVSAAQLPAFKSRLGGEPSGIVNWFFTVNGRKTQINAIEGKKLADARGIARTLLGMKKAPWLRRSGRVVLELVGDELASYSEFVRLVGCDEARYRVTMRLALLEGASGGHANEVFNLFLQRAEKGPSPALDARIRKIASTWKPTTTLRLFTPSRPGLTVTCADSPGADGEVSGDFTTLTYAAPETELGIPYADVVVECTVREQPGTPEGASASAKLREATAKWPVAAEPIKKIVAGLDQEKDRLAAIHEAVRMHVSFGGKVTGSRYGTLKVLEQGFGHCWDFSDIFVTVGRASGLPTRQVVGWLDGVSGHVWAEVFHEGKWVPVDPTMTHAGVTSRHVPYLATDDGNLSVLYLAMPKVERID